MSISFILYIIGILLLSNSAYSVYQINQLLFILHEHNNRKLNNLNFPLGLPYDVIIELLIGTLLVLLATIKSFYESATYNNEHITLKNGNWISNSKFDTHPLQYIDISRANTEMEYKGKGSYAYLENRPNFANLIRKAMEFKVWSTVKTG